MKNLLLILLLAAIGGWYCYDKYGKTAAPRGDSAEVSDPLAAEIRARAKTLFPTREGDRNAWISRQVAAMHALESRAEGLSKKDFDSIMDAARQRYGADYEKRLEYVSKQRTAAIDVANIEASLKLPPDALAELSARFREACEGDFCAMRSAYSEVSSALSEIARKSASLPAADAKKLAAKTVPLLLKNPVRAVEFFDAQALARHNFLSKQVPEALANAKAEIEQSLPDDYAAQLAALDSKLDGYMRSGGGFASFAADKISKLGRDYFAKYIYVADIAGESHPAFFAEVRGRVFAVFPSEYLATLPKSFSLDVGAGEKFSSDKIYLSKTSAFAIVAPPASANPDPIPTGKISSDDVAVEIVGISRAGAKLSVPARLKYGKKIEANSENASLLAEKMRSGALVVESETGKVVALFEAVPAPDAAIYARFDDPSASALAKIGERIPRWRGLDEVMRTARARMVSDGRREFAAVALSSLGDVSAYVPSKYSAQRANLEKICVSNFSALRFMLIGGYAEDVETPVISDVAEKYRPFFITGSRVGTPALYSKFSAYMNDVKNALVRNAAFARGGFYSEYYYDFSEAAKRQAELFAKLESVMTNAIAAPDKTAVLHADLAKCIAGSSFAPSGRVFSRQGFSDGGGGNVLRMRNVKKD